MTAVRNYLMILIAIVAIVALFGCSREITRVEQVDPGPSSCFECHSDQDPFLVAMEFAWANSWHASGRVVARSSRSSCAPCHSTEGFIQVANGEEVEGVDNPTVIHCFACHQPHSEGNFGLRKDDQIAVMDGTSYDIGSGNLCVNCHQARRDVGDYVFDGVEFSTHWGPHHGPQGDMLFGANGYEYEGYEYGETPWHRTQTDDGCVDCHYDYANTYAVGGHSFNMAVMDEEGEEVLNLGACVDCHGDDVEDFDLNMVQTDVEALLVQLGGLLETAGMVDADHHPVDGFVASADSAGALWNFLLVEEDRSHGVHNPRWAKSLLESSIDFMEGGN
jgi:hypothetical protein